MKLATFKIQVRSKYSEFGKVYCKAIKEHISFNNYGWKHISFDGKGHRRRNKNIIMRLNLVLYAPEVVKNASIVIKDETQNVIIKGNKRSVRNIEISYHIRKVNKYITVIIRRIGSGVFHFYSIRRTKNKIVRNFFKQKSP